MSSKIIAGTTAGTALNMSADTTGILELQTGSTPTTAITIDANQRSKFPTTIGVGGATPATTGSGITFPATNSPSSDANTLDDYETGTWTPTLTGFTGSPTITANYVKIGKVLYCSVTLGTSGTYITCTNGYLSQPFSGSAYGTGSYYCNDGSQRGVIQAVPYGNPAILSPGNITGTSVYLINFGWFMFVG
jgi:hypothetical protein